MLNQVDSCIIALFLNKTNANILTSTQITWQALQPDSTRYQSIFSNVSLEDSDSLAAVQPRLLNALAHLHHQTLGFPLLLLRSQENSDYLACIAEAAQRFQPEEIALYGGDYHVMGDTVSLMPPSDANRPFTSQGCVCASALSKVALTGIRKTNVSRCQWPSLPFRCNFAWYSVAIVMR